MGNAIDVTTASWDAEVASSSVPVVVDFWAPWCGPCRIVGPEVDKLAAQMGDSAKFVKVNVDESPELAARYDVMSIPTIAKFENGDLAVQVVGARGADALARELGLS
jgi:thioredoxin 1